MNWNTKFNTKNKFPHFKTVEFSLHTELHFRCVLPWTLNLDRFFHFSYLSLMIVQNNLVHRATRYNLYFKGTIYICERDLPHYSTCLLSPLCIYMISTAPFDLDLKDMGLPFTDMRCVVRFVVNPSREKSSFVFGWKESFPSFWCWLILVLALWISCRTLFKFWHWS